MFMTSERVPHWWPCVLPCASGWGGGNAGWWEGGGLPLRRRAGEDAASSAHPPSSPLSPDQPPHMSLEKMTGGRDDGEDGDEGRQKKKKKRYHKWDNGDKSSSFSLIQFYISLLRINWEQTWVWLIAESRPLGLVDASQRPRLLRQINIFSEQTCSTNPSTWLQRHHVVITVYDVSNRSCPPQAAETRLTFSAAVGLHQAAQRPVKPIHMESKGREVQLVWHKQIREVKKRRLTSWWWYKFHTWRSVWWSPT